jgi:hypothetical protein
MQNELTELKELYQSVKEEEIFPFAELAIGSRVSCSYSDGNTVAGRIWRISNDVISVNRDGYKAEMNFERSQVELASKTKKYEIERQMYLLIKSLEKIQNEIIAESYDFVSFDLSPTLNTEKIKIKIRLWYLTKVKNINAFMIKFKKEDEEEIRSAYVSSPLFENLKTGSYIFKFVIGHLTHIEQVK